MENTDFKSMIIGFLLATSMFLFMGALDYNDHSMFSRELTGISNHLSSIANSLEGIARK